MLNVQVRILNPRASLRRGSSFAAGYDLVSCAEKPISLRSTVAVLIPTGISIYIGDPNVAAVILPRSGLGHKQGLVLGNGTGLIDPDYQGELMVSAVSRQQCDEIIIKPGDRIAQLVFVPVIHPEFTTVTEFVATDRGLGGFGSTGVQ